MNKIKSLVLALILGVAALSSAPAFAAATDSLNREATQALQLLTKSNPLAADMAKHATAVLIFPNIVKAGLVFGGAYGEGVLQQDKAANQYYNSVTASFGWQAGAQSYVMPSF